MTTKEDRQYILESKAQLTQQAHRDLRSVCLNPNWLLRSLRSRRRLPEIAADFGRSSDPELVRLGGLLQSGAHLLQDSRSTMHLVNTMIAWLAADPSLDEYVQRYTAALRNSYLRPLWTVALNRDPRVHRLRRHHEIVNGCVFSADSQMLVTADRDTVLAWDVHSGDYVAELNPSRLWRAANSGNAPRPNRPLISLSSGQERIRLLTGGHDRLAVLTPDGVLGLWRMAGTPQVDYLIDTNRVGYTAQWLGALDADSFLSGSEDAIRSRSWATGRVLLTMPVSGQLAPSHLDARYDRYALEAQQRVVEIWNLKDRSLTGRLTIGRGVDEIAKLAIDGDLLLVADLAGAGQLWDWRRGELVQKLDGIFDLPQIDAEAGIVRWLREPGELVVSPIRTGGVLQRVVSRGLAMARRTNDDEDLYYGDAIRLTDDILATVASYEHPDGDYAHRVDMFDPRTGRRLLRQSAADQLLYTTTGSRTAELLIVTATGGTELWGPLGLTSSARVPPSFNAVQAATATPDGSWIAIATNADVHLLRPPTGATQTTPYPMVGVLFDVVVDPGGRWLATLTSKLELDVWDVATGQHWNRCLGTAPQTFRNGMDQIRAFSPDGRWVAFNDWDGTLMVWDPVAGQHLAGLPTQDVDLIHVAAGPNGPVAVMEHGGRSGQHRLSVWDVATRRMIAALPAADSVVGDSGGRWVAGIGSGNQVFVWDLAAGCPRPSPGYAAALAADPYGRWLYLSSDQGLAACDPLTGRWQSFADADGAVARTVVRPLLSADGERCALVHDDGQITVLRLSGNSRGETWRGGRAHVAKPTECAWELSRTGRFVAVADRHAGYLEVIDLSPLSAGRRNRASITLDGYIRQIAWHGDDVLLVIGDFGVQRLALIVPDRPR